MPRKRKPPTPSGPPVDPADVPLSVDETRFVEEYLIDRNAARAYRITFPGCGYHSARACGSEMVARPNVRREIRAALHAQAVRCQVRADHVTDEIKRVAFSDVLDLFDPNTNQLRHPRHIPFDLRRSIASIKVGRSRRSVTRNGRTRTTVTDAIVEYKLWNKLDALAKLANHLGLNTELPPIEALLALLPRDLATAVRSHLGPPPPNGKPHINGTRK